VSDRAPCTAITYETMEWTGEKAEDDQEEEKQ